MKIFGKKPVVNAQPTADIAPAQKTEATASQSHAQSPSSVTTGFDGVVAGASKKQNRSGGANDAVADGFSLVGQVRPRRVLLGASAAVLAGFLLLAGGGGFDAPAGKDGAKSKGKGNSVDVRVAARDNTKRMEDTSTLERMARRELRQFSPNASKLHDVLDKLVPSLARAGLGPRTQAAAFDIDDDSAVGDDARVRLARRALEQVMAAGDPALAKLHEQLRVDRGSVHAVAHTQESGDTLAALLQRPSSSPDDVARALRSLRDDVQGATIGWLRHHDSGDDVTALVAALMHAPLDASDRKDLGTQLAHVQSLLGALHTLVVQIEAEHRAVMDTAVDARWQALVSSSGES